MSLIDCPRMEDMATGEGRQKRITKSSQFRKDIMKENKV